MHDIFEPCENYDPMSVLKYDYIWSFDTPQTVMKSFFEYIFGRLSIYHEIHEPITTAVCTNEICLTVCGEYKLLYNSANGTIYFYNCCNWYFTDNTPSDDELYNGITNII